jgi:anti-repressor protein
MNEPQKFIFKGWPVRTVMVDQEPMFIGRDVAGVLGYSNTQKAIRDHVDDEDQTANDSFTVNGTPVKLINESGLYSLVLSSKMPNAKEFKHWVTSEVLPSIRQHGAYMTGDTIMSLLSNPDNAVKLLTTLSDERKARQEAQQQVATMTPKALFADAVVTSHTSILIGDLAKILKQNGIEVGAKRLFAWMREQGYLIKRKGADYNSPTQRAMELQLFEVKETAITHSDGHVTVNKTPKVTGKGQQYFVNKFLQAGEA